jgi:hypothetical protein
MGMTLWDSATRCRSRRSGHLTSRRLSDSPQRRTSSCVQPARRWGSHTTSVGIIAYDRDELADAAVFIAEAVELFAGFGVEGAALRAEAAAAVIGRRRPLSRHRLIGAADEPVTRRATSREIRARHGDVEDRIAPLSPRWARSAGRQLTLESAARCASTLRLGTGAETLLTRRHTVVGLAPARCGRPARGTLTREGQNAAVRSTAERSAALLVAAADEQHRTNAAHRVAQFAADTGAADRITLRNAASTRPTGRTGRVPRAYLQHRRELVDARPTANRRTAS